MLSAFSYVTLYFVFLWAELWLLARFFGDRFASASAPLYLRIVVLAIFFALPALGAVAIMTVPSGDFPDSY